MHVYLNHLCAVISWLGSVTHTIIHNIHYRVFGHIYIAEHFSCTRVWWKPALLYHVFYIPATSYIILYIDVCIVFIVVIDF